MNNVLHLRAPGNWINDPNGLIYFKGQYHLFFQYYPYEPVWGTMHWGHAVSTDLICWEHLGIALYPSKEFDRNGVFSGSAIENEDKLQLYYTAIQYEEENPENISVSFNGKLIHSQAMVISQDGIHFDNLSKKKQIISHGELAQVADPFNCRDPKVWKQGDKYFMCLGSTKQEKEGMVVLFESNDSVHWHFLNKVSDKRLGIIFECPDIFSIDDQYLLLGSPIGILPYTQYPENQSIYQMIDFDERTGEIHLMEQNGFLDYGMDLYAPQSNVDEEGRRFYIAWMRMPVAAKAKDNEASSGKEWNGLMSLPRLIEIRDGRIFTPVHPNVKNFFSDDTDSSVYEEASLRFSEGLSVKEVWKRKNRRITCSLKENDEIVVSGVRIFLANGELSADRTHAVSKDMSIHRMAKIPKEIISCDLEIYDSRNIIEIYVNDGEYVLSFVKDI